MSRARDLSNIINSSALSVDSAFNVGVNSISPTAKLDIGGNVVVGSGGSISVSAGGTFYGDGSGLTNVPSSGVISYASVAGVSTVSEGLTGTPNITVQDITAETVSIAGTLTYEDVTNIDSVGLVTARTGVEIGSPGIAATL